MTLNRFGIYNNSWKLCQINEISSPGETKKCRFAFFSLCCCNNILLCVLYVLYIQQHIYVCVFYYCVLRECIDCVCSIILYILYTVCTVLQQYTVYSGIQYTVYSIYSTVKSNNIQQLQTVIFSISTLLCSPCLWCAFKFN